MLLWRDERPGKVGHAGSLELKRKPFSLGKAGAAGLLHGRSFFLHGKELFLLPEVCREDRCVVRMYTYLLLYIEIWKIRTKRAIHFCIPYTETLFGSMES